ncbi:hypothetical protein T4A_12067 [Trichinella pseudospiralis]|uniref:Uncharacterized protein n=1 Tax=Trichinella pseudospiralis TaxID=6337 RepID=A0A0V1DET6_TRIPS|nr:hypothetical protein T4A_12067 [Trichinella pseudospiralis]
MVISVASAIDTHSSGHRCESPYLHLLEFMSMFS